MENYVKLVSKPDEYYDSGTEVFNYEGRRYTEEEWTECLEEGVCGARGFHEGVVDGDWSSCDEFEVVFGVEYAHLV